MKRTVAVILFLCMMLSASGLAQGLLPNLKDIFPVRVPTISACKPMTAASETPLVDGSTVTVYEDIPAWVFNIYKSYLTERGYTLKELGLRYPTPAELTKDGAKIEFDWYGGNLTSIEISKDDVSFVLDWDSRSLKAAITYPEGVLEEKTNTSKPRIGSLITMGSCMQGSPYGMEQKPIEWLVLDVKDGKALVISLFILNNVQADYRVIMPGGIQAVWENSTVRKWLNGEFLKTTFTAEEQARILTTNLYNDKTQCYEGWNYLTYRRNTQDKIFLLSYAEAHKYFGLEHYEVAGATENLKARAGFVEDLRVADDDHNRRYESEMYTADWVESEQWWLRSPGSKHGGIKGYHAVVRDDGSLDERSVTEYAGIRPAMWIKLK